MVRFLVFLVCGGLAALALFLATASRSQPNSQDQDDNRPLQLAQAEAQSEPDANPPPQLDAAAPTAQAGTRTPRTQTSPGMTRTTPAPGGAFEFWPGTIYSNAIPTLEEIVGHKNGDEITRSADVIKYFEALRAAAPNRVKIF